MLPDRVSNPGPLTNESGCPTDCATRPGMWVVIVLIPDHCISIYFLNISLDLFNPL